MTYLLTSLLCLLPPLAQAKTSTVLELQRLNYKPEKRLVYDLDFNPATCEINPAHPFDYYYRDNASGARDPDFSGNSQKYFAPRMENIGIHQAALAFKGFDEIEAALNLRAELMVYLVKSGGKCVPHAEITYGKRRFTLERIDLQMKKALGIPNGVESVLLKGHDEHGRVEDCVAGNCGN